MICTLLFICIYTGSVIATSSELAPPSHESVVKMLERSHAIQEEGYKALNKAFDILDRAFSFIESQTRASDNDQGITEALDSIMDRLDRIEAAISEDRNVKATENAREIASNLTQKLDSLERKVDAKLGQLESVLETGMETSSGKMELKLEEKTSEVIERVSEKVESLEITVNNKTSRIEKKIDTSINLSEKSVQLGTTIQTRQKAWLSEVRLISLFKLTDENNPHGNRDYNPGLVVDGQFTFSANHQSYMRTFSHTGSSAADNKIWIKLGGLFRVYCVRVWNTREGSKPRFSGTKIYVDDTLIGTASGDWGFHDFCLPEEKVVYGSRVTLHQPRSDYLILLEVQVWGNGPYNSTDLFN